MISNRPNRLAKIEGMALRGKTFILPPTHTPFPTHTPTPSPSPSPTLSGTTTPTPSPTSSTTASSTPTPSTTPSPTPSSSPSPTPSSTPSPTPSLSPSPSPSNTSSPTPSTTPSPTPSPSPSPLTVLIDQSTGYGETSPDLVSVTINTELTVPGDADTLYYYNEPNFDPLSVSYNVMLIYINGNMRASVQYTKEREGTFFGYSITGTEPVYVGVFTNGDPNDPTKGVYF
jgi:hypothetical protein